MFSIHGINWELLCVSFSVDQSSDQLRKDPRFTLIYVCPAVLHGVIVEHCGSSTNFFFFLNKKWELYEIECVFVSRMITLKVLNSIVLLGTSCSFVKAAKMEEKLFDPPPSAVSSRANSRAHRSKHGQTAPQQGCPLTLCYFHLKTNFLHSHVLINVSRISLQQSPCRKNQAYQRHQTFVRQQMQQKMPTVSYPKVTLTNF